MILTPENGSPRKTTELNDKRMAQTLLSRFMLEDIDHSTNKTEEMAAGSSTMINRPPVISCTSNADLFWEKFENRRQAIDGYRKLAAHF